ncbi:MAG: glutaredoxin family protein [Pseudomonadota bacterium]
MPHAFTVYVRRGCHLCSDMTQALERLRHELGFSYTTVDIDRDPALASRYGTRVPVLVGDGEELCYYFLEEERLRAHCGPAASRARE